MEFCTQCGEQLRADAKFCHNCGHRNHSPENAAETVSPKTMELPRAIDDTSVADNSTVEEAASLGQDATAEIPHQPSQRPSFFKVLLGMTLIEWLIVLALLFTGLILLLNWVGNGLINHIELEEAASQIDNSSYEVSEQVSSKIDVSPTRTLKAQTDMGAALTTAKATRITPPYIKFFKC